MLLPRLPALQLCVIAADRRVGFRWRVDEDLPGVIGNDRALEVCLSNRESHHAAVPALSDAPRYAAAMVMLHTSVGSNCSGQKVDPPYFDTACSFRGRHGSERYSSVQRVAGLNARGHCLLATQEALSNVVENALKYCKMGTSTENREHRAMVVLRARPSTVGEWGVQR